MKGIKVFAILIMISLIPALTIYSHPDHEGLAKLFEFDASIADYDDFYRYGETRKGIPMINFIRRTDRKNTDGSVLVIAEAGIFDICSMRIDRYISDIETQLNYSVIFYTVTKAVIPEDIKDILAEHYALDGIAGAVLIGDVSTAWYEIEDDFDSYGYTVFPIDLFYMDLDGIWTDTNSSGIYDLHEGNVTPEIFVGRINTATMYQAGSEEYLLNLYLDRNHQYWLGNMPLPDKMGLTYTDKDWAGGDDMKHDILYLYGAGNYQAFAYGDAVFSRNDYLSRVSNDIYGMIQFACHSSWMTHHLHNQPIIFTHQIFNLPPESMAYNLFNCSGCRWTAPTEYDFGFLGGAYVYNEGSNALFAVGSSKTGSMLGFAHYYEPLGQGKINGEAFKEWWKNYIGPTHEDWEIAWFYGMTIVGDPMVSLLNEPVTHFSGGDGSPENPFLIENASHLYSMRSFRDKHFRQIADIDMADSDYAYGSGWLPIDNFTGYYDGYGYSILNLFINRPDSARNGLFGRIDGAVLRNMSFHNVSINGGLNTGVLVGTSLNSTIESCYIHSGAISGAGSTGGLSGNVLHSFVSLSMNAADITGSQIRTGGLIGISYNTEISNSYNTGRISGTDYVGGLVGSLAGSSVLYSYSTGKVDGQSDSGGLIGIQQGTESSVIYSYWNTETSGQPTSQGGEGRTTSQMTYPHSSNTYMGWDFDNIWAEDPNYCYNLGYPLLQPLLDFDIDIEYFTAEGSGSSAVISWGTNSERNISGFNIYRIIGKKVSPFFSFAPVLLNASLIPASGGIDTPADYYIIDYVKPNGNFFYVLEPVSNYGYGENLKIRLTW